MKILMSGCGGISLNVSANEIGFSLDQWQQLNVNQRDHLRMKGVQKLQCVGAFCVVYTIVDSIPCLMDIEKRIRSGECP
jgi:hypothetical protein